jgi:hypothetical protein
MEGNSSAYLLVVWFNKISNQTVVWYAKTTDDHPAQLLQVPSGSSLQLTSQGTLSLLDPTGKRYGSPVLSVQPILTCSTQETLYWLEQMALPSGRLSKARQIPFC